MSNIVIANFVVGRNVTTRSLFQYNKGMKLRFANIELPETYRVDFSNSLHGTSKSMVGHDDGVEIPYEYFIPGENIYAWIVISREENETVTEYQVKIPVDPRAKPTDAKPSENQINFIDQTIAALNAGVSQVETAAERAEEIYENIQETVNTSLQEAKDSGEFDGEDGFSPEVTVAPIQGGHQITITDANGTHTVDVLDGENGDAGRGIVSVQKTGTVALVDTYTITYTDSTTSTFTVTNGQNGAPGTDGVTFTPVVSDGGVISWTNDGGKTNPQSVNIKGPQGLDGTSPTMSVADISGGHRVTVTDANGTRSFDVMDGDDYVLTVADKAEIAQQAAEEVDVPVQDVQVAGNSVLSNGVANVPIGTAQSVGVVKVGNGLEASSVDPGKINIKLAYSSAIKVGTDAYQSIGPAYQHETAFYGLAKAAGDNTQSASSNPVGTYTDEAKAAIQQMLDVPSTDDIPNVPVQDVQVNGTSVVQDGVANIPIASSLTPGVVRIQAGYGIKLQSDNNSLRINEASDATIKQGVDPDYPIVSKNASTAAFYGLAKVAGHNEKDSTESLGTYTPEAKSAIQTMLSGPVTVSGTTPSITALPGIQYICGECATLDIALPASGCIDVVFQSGSTPTVLTITPPTGVTVKWANGFDPTTLEANTTYEINIKDGLGVAASWT